MLNSLVLTNFRNYSEKILTFTDSFTVILGQNAVGKTNILEAITLLCTGESFRAKTIEEMIHWGEDVARVHGTGESHDLEVVLTRGIVQGKRVQKRRYLVDGASKLRRDFVGAFRCVLFHPEDLQLMTGTPAMRRKFLDVALSQADVNYRVSLESYEKALKRRNALLDLLREGRTSRAAFTFWDQLLLKHGAVLTEKRRSFLDYLNSSHPFALTFRADYQDSPISEKRLKQYEEQEVAAGHTLVGPHKDDFSTAIVKPNERNLSLYGSRGEQRLGVLWLKFGELAFLRRAHNDGAMLLLDDILSELDEEHQQLVLEAIGRQQTIITSTDDYTDFFSHARKQLRFDILRL